MRSVATELLHLFLSIPLIIILALAVLTLMAFREHAAVGLRRWRFILPLFAFAVYLVSAPVVSNTAVRWIESGYAVPRQAETVTPKKPVILVLTAGWLRTTERGYELKLSEAGWERTHAAVLLWKRHGGILVFSGAPTPDGNDSAAAGMARVAQQLGVPATAIKIEPASLNTYENFLFSKPLLDQHGGEIWLVTSALHMPRAMAVSKKVGVSAIAYPCDFHGEERLNWRLWLPSNAGPAMLEEALHELLGILQYRLRGWA